MSEATADLYERTPDTIAAPPETFGQILKQIGPGLILAASIVGTGELIATTQLGIKAGFALLWLVILSCFIKVFLQIELGRYAVSSGKTTLAMLESVPKVGAMLTWWWLIMMLATQNQIGTMIGGSGYAISQITGVGSTELWAVVITILTIALLVLGSYKIIERFATVLVGVFTLITVLCLVLIQFNPDYAISMGEIRSGLSFALPSAAVLFAFSMIGITGVGASELVAYPYWCLEKGYAKHVGPTDSSEEWEARARGWLRVMYVDAWLSMIVYTVATIAFYLLGAAFLHNKDGALPKSVDEMIPALSGMYAPVLGAQSAIIFITVGALVVLYSTLFAATAGNSRITVDFTHVRGFVSVPDGKARKKWVAVFCTVFPVLGLVLFLLIKNPIVMVTIGGVAQAASLPMLGAVGLYLRYKRMDSRLTPGLVWSFFLWISLIGFTIAAAFGLYSTVSKLM